MCKCGETKSVRVRVPADLSHTGKARWAAKKIDSCIATIVRALNDNEAGIFTRGSCCGHGKTVGVIDLWDGRALLILDNRCAAHSIQSFVGKVVDGKG